MLQVCEFDLYDFYMFGVDFYTAGPLHSSDLSKLVSNSLLLLFLQCHRNEVQMSTNERMCEDSNNEYYLFSTSRHILVGKVQGCRKRYC